ncbi:MAG: hypothetical protein ABR592_08490 [Nitriliruptorales bacterium]
MTPSTDARPSRRYITAALLVGLGLGAMVVLSHSLLALLAPAMLALLLLMALVRRLGRDFDDPDVGRQLMAWTIIAFVTHVVFGLVVTNVYGGVLDYLRAPDAFAYHSLAEDILRHWTTGVPGPELPAGKEGFYYVLAALYWVFGAHTAAGLVLNAALSAALVPLVTDTTRRLFGEGPATRVPPLVALLPGLFIWTSQLLKEAPILFLIALAAACAVRFLERVAAAPVLGLSLALAALFTFRAWVALVIAGGFVAALLVGRQQLAIGLTSGVTVLAILAVVVGLGLGYSGYRAAVDADLTQAQTVRQDLASAESGYDADVDVSTSRGALSYMPRGLVSFLLGPFPWQVRSARQLIVAPDVLVWWLLLPSLWRGLRQARRLIGRGMLVLVLPAITTSMLLALAVGNFGTVVRERGQVTILLVPIIALGLAARARARSASQSQDAEILAVEPARAHTVMA